MNSKVVIFSQNREFIDLCTDFIPKDCRLCAVGDFVLLQTILSKKEGIIVLADCALSKKIHILSKLRHQSKNQVFILSSKIEYHEKLPNYVIHLPFGFSKIASNLPLSKKVEEFDFYEKRILSNLCGSSVAMKKVRKKIIEASCCKVNVLFTGESGTGKSLAAAVLHGLSKEGRSGKNLVTENVAAISPSLIESELFGVAPSAYTDAGEGREGLISLADKGSIFLDEIGDLDFNIQAKLLLAVQEGRIRSVGSDESKSIDVRFIFATNQNLDEKIREKEFRQDLYYRISEIKIHLPPLRERIEDIDELAEKYFKDKNSLKRFSSQALSKLKDYHWPGNVREIEQCFASCDRLCQSELIGPEFIDF